MRLLERFRRPISSFFLRAGSCGILLGMTFLPIVQRELRLAARRRGTYWARLGIALVGTLIGAGILMVTLGAVSPQQTGQFIFRGLSGLLLVYGLAYGRRATADCLSSEKREGTLGLLFLTDLKGHDVVLGKLAATSLGGFYGLLAVMPVLGLCLLLGGVTSGEFWRMALVLAETFLLSLAIGMVGSALTRDFRRAMAANFALFLLLVAAGPACAGAILYFAPGIGAVPELMFGCPIYACYLAFDAQYAPASAHFWMSAGTVLGVTFLLVMVASWLAPRRWQDKPATAERRRWREVWQAWSYGKESGRKEYRRQLLDINAFYWLAARARRKPAHVWTFLGCLALWWLAGWAVSGRLWLDEAEYVLTAVLLNFALKVWVAIEAGQELADDQRSGAVELLLSVPLTVEDILRGQVLALRRQFLKPLFVALGAEVVFMLVLSEKYPGAAVLVTWLAGMAMLVLDLGTLTCVAMARALTARNHNQATISTVLRVLVLPWAIFGLIMGTGNVWSVLTIGTNWSPGWLFCVGLWFGLGLAADLWFGLRAWFQLKYHFRELALGRFGGQSAPSIMAPEVLSDPVSGRPSAPRNGKGDLGEAGLGGLGETALPAGAGPGGLGEAALPPGTGLGGLGEAALPAGAGPGGLGETALPPGTGPGGLGETALPASAPRKGGRERGRWVFGLLVLLAVCGVLIWRWSRPGYPAPVVVQVGSQPNWKLRASGGGSGLGILMILPDGSLWRWGLARGFGGTRARVPERLGTNSDWVRVSQAGRHWVGLRADGTIWEPEGYSAEDGPRQVDPGHDWVSVEATVGSAVALRRDGTLWAWGPNSASGPAGIQLNGTNLVQVGTTNDWADICGHWTMMLALRKDGTLWAWGQMMVAWSGGMQITSYKTPTRVSSDTNWAGFTSGILPQARMRSGELWDVFYRSLDPDAPASATCQLVLSNTAPGQVATAWADAPKIYQVRGDGSLWRKDYAYGPATRASTEDWRRVGKRSDWVSIWGSGGTALGLTLDGTLWTWGVDVGREPGEAGFSTKIKNAQVRLKTLVGGSRTAGSAGGMLPVVQKQPRPLMRLVSTNSYE